MRKLDLAVRAHRFLEALPPKQFRQVASAALALLREPYPHDSSKLHGHPYQRIDVGEYRIVYRAGNDVVQVVLLGKRNDDEVYRQLGRL